VVKIIKKEVLTPQIKLMVIDAPRVARHAKAGQFVIVRINQEGERIPLTIADFNPAKGTVTIIFQEVGKSTMQLGELGEGDHIADFVGPLGKEIEEKNFGHVVCVGGGVGIAPVYPKARALKLLGNRITSIIGARSSDLLFWEDQMQSVSDALYVTTDDGSYGEKGFVTSVLDRIIQKEKIDLVIAVGPLMMMKMVSLLTKKHELPTLVSLNPIMVVDGPVFDGHSVDYDELLARQRNYLEEEKRAVENWLMKKAEEGVHYV